jgi:hypothetical protein
MSTLDEITKEKQRIAEALAHVNAQREKLTGQLGELEAAERVLARYSKGTPARKPASAKTSTTAAKAGFHFGSTEHPVPALDNAASGFKNSGYMAEAVVLYKSPAGT